MAYPFVQAKYFTRNGLKEARAVVVHMAEGGGTVSWLTHPTNDNSPHFVIEYSGKIVQMVAWADADHSLHVAVDADTHDAPDFGIYSLAAARTVLGADGLADPNAYLIAIEMEGFAADGPNAQQIASLKSLIATIRAHYGTLRGNLGHRDFQDYKACPGGLIPWAAIGGHGLYQQETPVVDRLPIDNEIESIVTVAAGTPWLDDDGKTVLDATTGALAARRSPYGVGQLRAIFASPNGGERRIVLVKPLTSTPAVDLTPYSTADLDASAADGAKQGAIQERERIALAEANRIRGL